MTHTIDEKIPTWGGKNEFNKVIVSDYDNHGFRVMHYNMVASIGTHIDAPSHCFAKGLNVDDIPIDKLIANACVINVSQKCINLPDYKISVDDIKNYEEQYGKITQKNIVLGCTGWSKRWQNTELYRNQEKNSEFWKMHFPTFSSEAADLLLEKNIIGIGIDTFSPDNFFSDWAVHKKFLGNGKYILENLNNLDQLDPVNSLIIALPLKIYQSSEAPTRIIGLVQKK